MPKESVSFHPQNYIFYKLPLDCFRPHRQVTPLTQPWTRPCKLSNGLSPWRRNDAEDSSLCGWLDKTPTKIIEKNCFCGPEECSSRNRTESITIYRMQDRDHLQDSSLISLTDEDLQYWLLGIFPQRHKQRKSKSIVYYGLPHWSSVYTCTCKNHFATYTFFNTMQGSIPVVAVKVTVYGQGV